MSVARVRGIELAYDESGTGSPLLLLHGFPLNRTMWSEQMAALSSTHRVIAPDLRGFGETSATVEPATMEELARDVAALLDELRIERASIGGLSMGGYVAFEFYRFFARRTAALILIDTRPQADDEEAKRNRAEMAARARREGMQTIVDAMLPKLLAPSTYEQQPTTVERVRQMILTTKPEGACAALAGMAARRDQTELLSEITAPALIIVGSDDQITPPVVAEQMQRAISGSRLEVINGAGHVSNLERPDEFNSPLKDFLSLVGA